jgi:hypothetical protein
MIAHAPASPMNWVAGTRVRVVVFTSPLTLPGPPAYVKSPKKGTTPLTIRREPFSLESRMTTRAKKFSFAVISARFHLR